MFEKSKPSGDVPLDLFVGLLSEHRDAYGAPGIYELQFVNGYRRIPTTQIDWITPDGITMWNASDFLFPVVEYDWGWITHFGLWLTEEGSDCLCVGDLHAPIHLTAGNHVCFQMKKIDVEIELLAHEYKQYKFKGE